MPQHNTTISAVSDRGYAAARHGAAFFARTNRGRIVMSGRDRASYLQGLLTSDVAALKAGAGQYAAYLTPQGRMVTDLYLYELGDVMLLVLPRDTTASVLAKFDQFVFTEDVQVADATDVFTELAVIGPSAAGVVARSLQSIDVPALHALPEHGNLRASFLGQPAIVARVRDTGEPGYDLYVKPAQEAALVQALEALDAVALDEPTSEALRIEAGVPVFGRDMDAETIPLEAGIESRAISFTKGCYVGQEVIIRVLHRGHGRIARKLVGLVLDGDALPGRGTGVLAGEREVGSVTSSTWSPLVGKTIALAYVHRDFMSPGTGLIVGGRRAVTSELPFVHQPTN